MLVKTRYHRSSPEPSRWLLICDIYGDTQVDLNVLLCPSMSDFRDLVEHGQFVDKTLALCDFLADGVRPVHLLLRPRRSGKTTLLRMFR